MFKKAVYIYIDNIALLVSLLCMLTALFRPTEYLNTIFVEEVRFIFAFLFKYVWFNYLGIKYCFNTVYF